MSHLGGRPARHVGDVGQIAVCVDVAVPPAPPAVVLEVWPLRARRAWARGLVRIFDLDHGVMDREATYLAGLWRPALLVPGQQQRKLERAPHNLVVRSAVPA